MCRWWKSWRPKIWSSRCCHSMYVGCLYLAPQCWYQPTFSVSSSSCPTSMAVDFTSGEYKTLRRTTPVKMTTAIIATSTVFSENVHFIRSLSVCRSQASSPRGRRRSHIMPKSTIWRQPRRWKENHCHEEEIIKSCVAFRCVLCGTRRIEEE